VKTPYKGITERPNTTTYDQHQVNIFIIKINWIVTPFGELGVARGRDLLVIPKQKKKIIYTYRSYVEYYN